MADDDNPYHVPLLQSNNQFLLAIQQVFPYNVFVVPNHNNTQRGAVSQFYQSGGPPVNARVVGLVQSREIADSIAQILNGMHAVPAIEYSISQLSNAVHHANHAQSFIAQFVEEYNSRGALYYDSTSTVISHQWSGAGTTEWYQLNRNAQPVPLIPSYNTQHIVDKAGLDGGYHSSPEIIMGTGNNQYQYSGNIAFENTESFSAGHPYAISSQYEVEEINNRQPCDADSNVNMVGNDEIDLPQMQNTYDQNTSGMERNPTVVESQSSSSSVPTEVQSPHSSDIGSGFPSDIQVATLANSCREKEAERAGMQIPRRHRYMADSSFYMELRRMVFGTGDYLNDSRELNRKFPGKLAWIRNEVSLHFPVNESMATKRYYRLDHYRKKLHQQSVLEEQRTASTGRIGKVAWRSDELPSQEKVKALAMECRSLVGLPNTSDSSEVEADELFVEKLRLETFGREEYLLTKNVLDALYPGKMKWLTSQLNEHFSLGQDEFAKKSRKARLLKHLNNLRQLKEKPDGGNEDSTEGTSNPGKLASSHTIVSFKNTVTFNRPRSSTVRPLPKSKKTGIRYSSVVPARSYSLPTDMEVELMVSRLPKKLANPRARRDIMFFVQLQSKLFQKIEQYGTDPNKQAWVWRQMNKHFPMENEIRKNQQKKVCLGSIAKKKRRLREILESAGPDSQT